MGGHRYGLNAGRDTGILLIARPYKPVILHTKTISRMVAGKTLGIVNFFLELRC
jgi:hypothetical protein